MAIQFDPQTFLGGIGAQNDFPGNPFSAFSAGIRGALVARALKQKAAKDALDAQAEQDMKDRMYALQLGQLGVAQEHLTLDQKRQADEEAKAAQKQNDFLGVLPYGSVGPLAPGEVMAPANVPTGGFKAYAEEAGKAAATPPKPEKDPFALFVKEQQYKAAHPEADAGVPDINSLMGTTASGHQFIDVSQLTQKQKGPIVREAYAQGLVPVDKTGMQALGVIDKARSTLNSQLATIQPFLAKTAGGRVANYPNVKLGQIFQTNPDLGAYSAWRDGAVQALQGLAAGGTGLRIQQAAINNMIAALPLSTDTWATAQRKIQIIQGMIDNAERPIVTRNWGKKGAPSGGSASAVEWEMGPNGPRPKGK